MLGLGLLGLWFLSAYEVYQCYSLLYLGFYVMGSYILLNNAPLLVGYESVKGNDAVWMLESETNRMIIVTVAELTKCTAEQVKNTLKERVFHEPKRAKRYFTYILGKPFWVEDKNFSLDDHFQVVKEEIGNKEELSTLAGKLVSTPFPEHWPLWCIYVIEDFQGGSAVICKFHHFFLDGTAGVNAWVHASDPQCKREFFKMPKFNRRQSLYTLFAAIYLPFYMLFSYFYKGDRNPLLGPALSGVKTLAWTRHYDLAKYKEKCKQKGITLNDLIGAAALRTLRKYIAETYGQNHEKLHFLHALQYAGSARGWKSSAH